MMNATYEPISPISEEATPIVSDDEGGPEGGNEQGVERSESTSVLVFDLMSARCHRRLTFVELCIDYSHEYFLYLHPTQGTHYAARLLDLG